jgi:hypothetical protein
MADSPYRRRLRATLPEAATDRGLRRMSQTPAAGNLRAKTGTIDRVSALSGYVTARNGERLAFAILANDVPSTWTAKRVEDRIGARLAALERPVPSRRLADGGGPEPGERPGAARAGDDGVTARALARADSAAARAPDRSAPETGTRVAQEAAEPEPADTESAEASYVIRSGDTLDGIARRNDTSVQARIRECEPRGEPPSSDPGPVHHASGERERRLVGEEPPGAEVERAETSLQLPLALQVVHFHPAVAGGGVDDVAPAQREGHVVDPPRSAEEEEVSGTEPGPVGARGHRLPTWLCMSESRGSATPWIQ